MINSKISHDNQGAVIAFSDPAYLRSDVIVFDEADGSLHAICHEASHLIGHVEGELAEKFAGCADIWLTATHFTGAAYQLKVPLKVSK